MLPETTKPVKRSFWTRLTDLGFTSYDEYLASPIWRDFKKRYRAAGLPCACAVCGGRPVQLHHHTYERLGEELLTDVLPLCRDHHEQVHACLKTLKLTVRSTPDAIVRLKAGERFDAKLVVGVKVQKRRKHVKAGETGTVRKEERRAAKQKRKDDRMAIIAELLELRRQIPDRTREGYWHREYNSMNTDKLRKKLAKLRVGVAKQIANKPPEKRPKRSDEINEEAKRLEEWQLKRIGQGFSVNNSPGKVSVEERAKARNLVRSILSKKRNSAWLIITEDLISRGQTPGGGYTKQQLAILGVSWPPIKGWKRGVIGKSISDEDAKRFVDLKNEFPF